LGGSETTGRSEVNPKEGTEMVDLSVWQGYATQCKGEILVWINQTDALKGTGSEGVCNAITRDWIDSLDSIRARAAFYNNFRCLNEAGQFRDYCMPAGYIQRQKKLEAENKARQKTLTKLRLDAQAYEKKHPGDTTKSEKVFKLEASLMGGPKCQDVFPLDTREDVIEHLNLAKGTSFAGALHLLTDSGGHAVALEFQPGKEGGEDDFVYHFIDPNTGWFAFSQYNHLRVFVQVVVLKNYYPASKYNRFKIYHYRWI